MKKIYLIVFFQTTKIDLLHFGKKNLTHEQKSESDCRDRKIGPMTNHTFWAKTLILLWSYWKVFKREILVTRWKLNGSGLVDSSFWKHEKRKKWLTHVILPNFALHYPPPVFVARTQKEMGKRFLTESKSGMIYENNMQSQDFNIDFNFQGIYHHFWVPFSLFKYHTNAFS